MQYLKRNSKYSIFVFLVIVLSITVSISTLAKTEVYFSFYDNPQISSTTSPKPKVQSINFNTATQDEFIKILHISEPLAQKIIDFPFMSFPRTRESITLRDELGWFKDLQTLPQLPEITSFEWQEWKEQGIIITIK